MTDERRPSQIVLVRHAETEWSASGRHTSFTDVPLTEEGRRKAADIGSYLRGRRFEAVMSSPMQRAIETCRTAGFGDVATVRSELKEWDYGEYEGVTTAEIRGGRPDWLLWVDGAPGGESPRQVQDRVDSVIEELHEYHGDVALFSHGHLLRALAARWINLPVERGKSLRLGTGSVSVLGWEREIRVIDQWNREL